MVTGASRDIHRQMTMKRILTLVLLLAIPVLVTARLMQSWSYQEMFDKADLVAIAKPVSTKVTAEKGKLPHFSLELTGLSTEFETRTVMKGDKTTNRFVLHHYRLAKPNGPVTNGPNLVAFDPAQHHSFLLFLTKEADGRYAPVTGQTDPGVFSVIKLEGVAQ